VVRMIEPPKSADPGQVPTHVQKAPDPRAEVTARRSPSTRERPADRGGRPPRRDTGARWWWVAAVLVLCPVAGIGAALSFQSLHQAAVPIFGRLAFGFPVLVDMLILGSMLAYLAGATTGRALPGWRWTAHGGACGTLLLNAMTASSAETIPWHITPALVWSVLVEMTARQVTAYSRAPHTAAGEPIPARLWVSSPVDAVRTWLQMARTGERSHRQARADLALRAAAEQALQTAMPRHRQRATRKLIRKQLRAGALDPAALLRFLHDQDDDADQPAAAVVIQTFLTAAPKLQERPQPATGEVTRKRSPEEITAPHLPGPPTSRTPPLSPTGTPQPDLPASTPSGRKRTHGEPTRQWPDRSSELNRRRGQAAAQILQAQPGIDGTQLARELGHRGWDLSPRTARRILARTARERPSQRSETQPVGSPDLHQGSD